MVRVCTTCSDRDGACVPWVLKGRSCSCFGDSLLASFVLVLCCMRPPSCGVSAFWVLVLSLFLVSRYQVLVLSVFLCHCLGLSCVLSSHPMFMFSLFLLRVHFCSYPVVSQLLHHLYTLWFLPACIPCLSHLEAFGLEVGDRDPVLWSFLFCLWLPRSWS